RLRILEPPRQQPGAPPTRFLYVHVRVRLVSGRPVKGGEQPVADVGMEVEGHDDRNPVADDAPYRPHQVALGVRETAHLERAVQSYEYRVQLVLHGLQADRRFVPELPVAAHVHRPTGRRHRTGDRHGHRSVLLEDLEETAYLALHVADGEHLLPVGREAIEEVLFGSGESVERVGFLPELEEGDPSAFHADTRLGTRKRSEASATSDDNTSITCSPCSSLISMGGLIFTTDVRPPYLPSPRSTPRRFPSATIHCAAAMAGSLLSASFTSSTPII